MYVNMQGIGNALSGNQGWNDKEGRAARYNRGSHSYRDWKPDMSICTGSSGLLLSTKIDQIRDGAKDSHGALMLWFDANAKLLSAELQWANNANGETGETGAVSRPSPQEIGAEIQRLTPTTNNFDIGAGANHSVVALASGVYKLCKIISIHSGKALDISGGSTQDGAKLLQWQYTGAENQQWRLVPVSPDSYIIVSAKSSKALDVPGHSTSNGTQIEQWTYNGGANQHWRLIELGNNDYKIESVESGKVLDVLNASTSDGAPVQQYGYGQAMNQRWRIDGL